MVGDGGASTATSQKVKQGLEYHAVIPFSAF